MPVHMTELQLDVLTLSAHLFNNNKTLELINCHDALQISVLSFNH